MAIRCVLFQEKYTSSGEADGKRVIACLESREAFPHALGTSNGFLSVLLEEQELCLKDITEEISPKSLTG
ncbi:hypothetical protein D3C84_993550 [compost metagenome]